MRPIRYRYCTRAVAGRWRNKPADAVEDAIRAGQAVRDPASPDGWRWLVDGEIETRSLAEIKARSARL